MVQRGLHHHIIIWINSKKKKGKKINFSSENNDWSLWERLRDKDTMSKEIFIAIVALFVCKLPKGMIYFLEGSAKSLHCCRDVWSPDRFSEDPYEIRIPIPTDRTHLAPILYHIQHCIRFDSIQILNLKVKPNINTNNLFHQHQKHRRRW